MSKQADIEAVQALVNVLVKDLTSKEGVEETVTVADLSAVQPKTVKKKRMAPGSTGTDPLAKLKAQEALKETIRAELQAELEVKLRDKLTPEITAEVGALYADVIEQLKQQGGTVGATAEEIKARAKEYARPYAEKSKVLEREKKALDEQLKLYQVQISALKESEVGFRSREEVLNDQIAALSLKVAEKDVTEADNAALRSELAQKQRELSELRLQDRKDVQFKEENVKLQAELTESRRLNRTYENLFKALRSGAIEDVPEYQEAARAAVTAEFNYGELSRNRDALKTRVVELETVLYDVSLDYKNALANRDRQIARLQREKDSEAKRSEEKLAAQSRAHAVEVAGKDASIRSFTEQLTGTHNTVESYQDSSVVAENTALKEVNALLFLQSEDQSAAHKDLQIEHTAFKKLFEAQAAQVKALQKALTGQQAAATVQYSDEYRQAEAVIADVQTVVIDENVALKEALAAEKAKNQEIDAQVKELGETVNTGLRQAVVTVAGLRSENAALRKEINDVYNYTGSLYLSDISGELYTKADIQADLRNPDTQLEVQNYVEALESLKLYQQQIQEKEQARAKELASLPKPKTAAELVREQMAARGVTLKTPVKAAEKPVFSPLSPLSDLGSPVGNVTGASHDGYLSGLSSRSASPVAGQGGRY